MMNNSIKSKVIFDSDDFEMDDIITEFAQEEMKNTKNIVQLPDSDDEMENLLDEFAETQSNSDSGKNKSSANVILPSSDDEMDDILEEFREEISSETKSDLSEKTQSETRTIIIQDSANNNGTIYDSSVEILVSDDIDNKSEDSFVFDDNEDISINESHFTSMSEGNDENDNYSIKEEDNKTVLDIKLKEDSEDELLPIESILSVQSKKDLSIDTKNALLSIKEEHEELDNIKSPCSNIILPEVKAENLLDELQSSDKKDVMSNTEILEESNASITKNYTENSILLSDKCVNSFAAPNSPGDPSVPIKISNVEKSDTETNTELSKLKVSKDNVAIEIFSTSKTNVDVLPKNTTVNQDIPEDKTNEDVLPNDISVTRNISEDASNEDVLPKDTSVNQNVLGDAANVNVLPKDSSVHENILEEESLDSAKSERENLFSDSDSMDVDNRVILKISEKLDELEVMSGNASLSSGSEQADVKSDDTNFLSFGNSDNKDNVDSIISDVKKVLDNLITKIEESKLCPTPENDCDLTSDDKIEVMDIDLNVTLTSIVPSVETMKDILESVKLNESILKQDLKPGSNDSKEDALELEIINDSSDVINDSEKSKESSGESPGDHTTNLESFPEKISVTVSESLNKVSEALPTTKGADSPLTGESDCEIEEILVIEPEKPEKNAFKTVGIENKANGICFTQKNLSLTEDIVKETLNNHFNELISKESKKRKFEVSGEETVNKVKRIDNRENDVSPTCLIDSLDGEFSAHPGKEKVQWNSEKLVVTDKDIEKVAQEAVEKICDRYYSQELEEVTAKLKNFKLQYQKISEVVDYFRKMQMEFRSSQKVAMSNAVYTKPAFRTVGVNVKICKEVEIRKPSLTKNTEPVEIIEEKSVTKEPRGYKRPKSPEKKSAQTNILKTSELPTSKYAIDLPSNVINKEKLLIPENVPQSQSATKKVPVTSATQRTPLPNILKPFTSRNIVEPPKDLQPKPVAAPVTKAPLMNGEIKGTPGGANVLIPFNDFLQMLPNAGRGFIIPQTRPSSSVPAAPTSVVRTFMVPRQDPRLNAGQTVQTFLAQTQPNQQLYHGPAFQVTNTVQRKTMVCPVRPMMVQAPTAGNPPQKIVPVTMRYKRNFQSSNLTTPSGQTAQVFTQYHPVSSFNQALQPSLPKTSAVHRPPSKPVQAPARFTSTSLLGSSILRQSLFAPSNPNLIGQPIAATKEYVQLLNTKPYPQVPVSPSYTDANAKPLPPKPELKASKKNDNKSIVLSWNLALTDKHATVTGYHIFSCQVKNANKETKGWKKTGEVGAMVLPMACTLQQFENDTSYHFIVRAVDKLQRLGPFSDPVSISF